MAILGVIFFIAGAIVIAAFYAVGFTILAHFGAWRGWCFVCFCWLSLTKMTRKTGKIKLQKERKWNL